MQEEELEQLRLHFEEEIKKLDDAKCVQILLLPATSILEPATLTVVQRTQRLTAAHDIQIRA